MSRARKVPVEAARWLGQRYRQDEVIVLTHTEADERLSIATWGRLPEHKAHAARVGEQIAQILGGLASWEYAEDYRSVDAGRRAQVVDALAARCRAAHRLVCELLRGHTPDAGALRQMRQDLSRVLDGCGDGETT